MRFILGLIIVIILAFLVSSVYSASSVLGKRIVIDAGHGGTDIGSAECSVLEKDVTLDIAQRLQAKLETNGAIVTMTRTDDSTKSNNDRYTLANSVNGDVLISIHLNGSTDRSVNGTLGLYGKRGKDKDFTTVLHNRLASELGVSDQGITNFASGVLLKSNMPSSIQERVFISNTNECSRLTDGSGDRQQEIADSLYNGLVDWFNQPPSDDKPGNGKGRPNK